MVSHLIAKTEKSKNDAFRWKTNSFIATVFWDAQGVLYLDFLTERRTIDAGYYSSLQEGPVKRVIRNKWKKS